MLRAGGWCWFSLIATKLSKEEGNTLKPWHALGTAGQDKALHSSSARGSVFSQELVIACCLNNKNYQVSSLVSFWGRVISPSFPGPELNWEKKTLLTSRCFV